MVLKSGMKGKVVEVLKDKEASDEFPHPFVVKFEQPSVKIKFDQLNARELFNYTDRGGWYAFSLESPKEWSTYYVKAVEPPNPIPNNKILIRARVIYNGPEVEVYPEGVDPKLEDIIPDGSKGVVSEVWVTKERIKVVWYEGEVIKQPILEKHYEGAGKVFELNKQGYRFNDVIFLARNRVNFEEMRKKYLE